jgi:hypothetical protein
MRILLFVFNQNSISAGAARDSAFLLQSMNLCQIANNVFNQSINHQQVLLVMMLSSCYQSMRIL